MSTGADETGGGLLRRLYEEGQPLLGCPDWCTWAVTHPAHEHLAVSGAEVVVYPCSEEPCGEALAEVRHVAAPTPPPGTLYAL